MAQKMKKGRPSPSQDSWLYKPRRGAYRHQTAVRCIKPWPGKYKPRQK